MDMIQLAIGALALSVNHALMPDHWIPLVMISRAEGWTRAESSWIAALIAIPHTVSTILVGVLIGVVGHTLSSTHEFIMGVAAPLVLIAVGLVYVALDFRGHDHHGHEGPVDTDAYSERSRFAIAIPLATALFFSPCIAMVSYFFLASTGGWPGIVMVSVIYLIVTVLGLVLMVNLALSGMERIEWHFLEEHERLITGIVLIALGVLVHLVEG